MGIIPIIIGIIKLRENYKKRKNDEELDINIFSKLTKSTNPSRQSLSFLSVAAITFSNGSYNIGIYTPLLASINSTFGPLAIIIVIFMGMTALWCSMGYYLVNHSFLANNIRRIGHLILPFVLIGLGIYIITEEFLI